LNNSKQSGGKPVSFFWRYHYYKLIIVDLISEDRTFFYNRFILDLLS